jgi:putative ubiquitin-RnfH superfamily antitoxin RatB of RatAB toxin-antitoxin module
MGAEAMLHVQVCFARPGLEFLRDVAVREGATLMDAIVASGVMREYPEIDLDACRVGVFGKLKTLDTVLRERDRVEIYRRLMADPKDSRRTRAEKKGGGQEG